MIIYTLSTHRFERSGFRYRKDARDFVFIFVDVSNALTGVWFFVDRILNFLSPVVDIVVVASVLE